MTCGRNRSSFCCYLDSPAYQCIKGKYLHEGLVFLCFLCPFFHFYLCKCSILFFCNPIDFGSGSKHNHCKNHLYFINKVFLCTHALPEVAVSHVTIAFEIVALQVTIIEIYILHHLHNTSCFHRGFYELCRFFHCYGAPS